MDKKVVYSCTFFLKNVSRKKKERQGICKREKGGQIKKNEGFSLFFPKKKKCDDEKFILNLTLYIDLIISFALC